MSQQIKGLVAKLGSLGSRPGAHLERQKLLVQILLYTPMPST